LRADTASTPVIPRFKREHSTMNRQLFTTLMLVLVAFAACAHRAEPAGQFNSAIAPFTHSRDVALRLVGSAKHALGADDLNSLTVAYTALEERGNAYAGFLVSAVDDASFSQDKNAAYASSLVAAINKFNKAFRAIAPQELQGVTVDAAWVTPFATTVSDYWDRYHAALPALPAQRKTDLIKQLKAETVWPNYEDVATVETIARP
jgi:hypothetical protein